MSLLNEMSRPKQNNSRINIGVVVTGYMHDPDPTEARIIGRRVDTHEMIEVRVPPTNNQNQPQVSDIEKNVTIGGSIILGSSYVDAKAQRKSSDSSYVVSCRWPRMLTPNQAVGACRVANARVTSPYMHEDGRVQMNVFILNTESHTITSMEQFEKAFFFCLNPDKSSMGAIPYAGVRLSMKNEKGELVDAKLNQFSPTFGDDYGPNSIQATFNEYKKNGTVQNDSLNKISRIVSAALQDDQYVVEVVGINKFPVGMKTKTAIASKVEKNNPPSTWECVPTTLTSAEEGEEHYTGYAPCTIGFRPHRSGNGFYITGAIPVHSDGLITKTGIQTLAETKNRFAAQRQASSQQQTPAQQSVPAQRQAPSQQQSAPAQQQPAPAQQQRQAQYQASAEYQAPAPAQQVATPFLIQDAGDQWFAITPPNTLPEMEESIFKSLGSLGESLQENGLWYFSIANYEQVKAQLEAALHLVGQQHPQLAGGLMDHSNLGAPSNQMISEAPDSRLGEVDLSDLGSEIDAMFPSSASNGLNQ